MEELKKRGDSGEMKVALALYPVSMKQLMDIADTGNIMPPKTTWFEPKLRSGLVIHKPVSYTHLGRRSRPQFLELYPVYCRYRRYRSVGGNGG